MLSLSLVLGLLASGLTTGAPAVAEAPTASSIERLCGPAQPGLFTCFGMRHSGGGTGKGVKPTAAPPKGYSPADLLDAYALPRNGGAGQTVAIVDAYDNPNAEADLAVYRAQYGLPPCTTANGCFRKVDQWGGNAYPIADEGWAGEMALDLDMVSAIAPRARIVLVEASTARNVDLGTAVNEAVALGAKFVSNSYGGYYNPDPSDAAELAAMDAAYYDHPGVAVVASAGDWGYGVSYPASSAHVTAVGGTTLTRTTTGWQESVWNSSWTGSDGLPAWGATGSGCATDVPKPKFQTDSGCAGRSVADVSAVADPVTGVAVYDTFTSKDPGWNVFGGTSASAPIIAGVYAVAGTPAADTYPNSYPYQRTGALHDVTTGDDDSCAAGVFCGFGTSPDCSPGYLCQGATGYDGPTGLGTPDGMAAFKAGPHAAVTGTVTDAKTHAPVAGASVTIGDVTVTTDANGYYHAGLAPGQYGVTVAAYGYQQATDGLRLPDGNPVKHDVRLTALPSHTITGTVSDGSGHGWGLSAKLTVEGVPGAPVYTDPTTGRYRITLPRNASYTIDVSATDTGYQSKTVTVKLTDRDVTADVALPVDQTSDQAAPGYAVNYHGGGRQPFAGPSTPDGWSVVNHTDTGGWRFDDPLRRGNLTGGDGAFAIADDWALGWGPVDTELVSPAYDMSAEDAPQLAFDTSLPWTEMLDDSTSDVDISLDGGATWTNVWKQLGGFNVTAHVVLPLTAAAGQPSVRVRFHYVGDLSGFWQLDNIAIGTRSLDRTPGGLLVGRVTDANTGAGVTLAKVTAGPDGAANTSSTAGGLYRMFAPAGQTAVGAAKPGSGYQSAQRDVTVAADRITTADLALKAGRVAASVGQVATTVTAGERGTQTVRLTNTGTAPVTVSLGEQKVSAAATPAAPERVKADLSPSALAATLGHGGPAAAAGSDQATGAAVLAAATPADAATWTNAPNLAQPLAGGFAAAQDGILYTGLGMAQDGSMPDTFAAYDPTTGTWQTLASPADPRFEPVAGIISGHLYVTGGLNLHGFAEGTTEAYDLATGAWSTVAPNPVPFDGSGSAIVDGKLYVVGGCDLFTGCASSDVQVYDAATDTWTATTPYPVPVGFLSCGAIAGKIYCAGGEGIGDGVPLADYSKGYSYDPKTAKWSSIADLPLTLSASASAVANGQLLMSTGFVGSTGELTNEGYAYDPATDTWSALPPAPLPLYYAAGALGFYVVGGQVPGGIAVPLVLVLNGYDQVNPDLSWLSATPGTVTIQPGASVTVTVTLDATALPAGRYTGALVIGTDSPYPAQSLPVAMVATKPRPGHGRSPS